MKNSRIKYSVGIFIALVLLGFGYYYWKDISNFSSGLLNRSQPCQKPIMYSIGNIDPRFGLTKAELLNDMQTAEKIWESSIGKQLFEYSPTGDLKINLIYDYRQKATDAMSMIGIVINDDKSTFDALKAKYNSLTASYDKQKAQIEALVATYNTEKSAYEKDVSYWNSHKGAPKAEYDILEQKRIDLNNQITIINQQKDSLNGLIDTINSAGLILNKLIAELNLQVSTYNTAGSAIIGTTFDEGQYVSDVSGTTINIFQFDNADQLIRVLAHELGHALGLGHLANSKAIMYYLNEGINEKLTADDLTALKNICGIK